MDAFYRAKKYDKAEAIYNKLNEMQVKLSDLSSRIEPKENDKNF